MNYITHLVQMVKDEPLNIAVIDKPSERVQLAAVEQDPYVIVHIKEPTEKVQLLVIERDFDLISEINNPTEKAIKLAEKLRKEWDKESNSIFKKIE